MKKNIITTLILAAFAVGGAHAVPAMRGLRPVLQADGSTIMIQRVGDERLHFNLDSAGALLRSVDGIYRHASLLPDGSLADSPVPVKWESEPVQTMVSRLCEKMGADASVPVMRTPGIGMIPGRTFPVMGEQKAIVILVEYTDVKFTHPHPYEYFHDMLNKEGFSDPEYGGTGSCRDYFIESSMGKFVPQFDVFGPVTLPNNRAYYGANSYSGLDPRASQMVVDACRALDAEVDFAEYDRDNDGVIDNVFLFYAGQGEATYGPDDSVWPHSSSVSGGIWLDGKMLSTYGCTNEWGYDRPDGIGTFVHEFSHVIGLPDLYSTSSHLTCTPGNWNVLDYGPYNNDGRTPPAYSTFERNALGWIDPEDLTADGQLHELPDLRASNVAYRLINPANRSEFYLFENRCLKGSDEFLPGEGMLVWHVEYNASRWRNNIVNVTPAHQFVDLIEADGIAAKTVRDGGDAFPGETGMRRLDLKWWSGRSTGVALRDITADADAGVVTFKAMESPSEPGDVYTVDQVLASKKSDESNGAAATVGGYVVGYARTGTFSSRTAVFGTGMSKTNVILAASPDETDWCDCITVQLAANSEARAGLNLSDHPENLGKYVEVTGVLSEVNGYYGVKDCSVFRFVQSSIESVEADGSDDASAEWFTLQGVRVDSPSAPGVYVKRTVSGSRKIKL